MPETVWNPVDLIMQPDEFEPGTVFTRLFRVSPVPMHVTALDRGIIADVNDTFAQLFGHTREGLIGKPVEAIFGVSAGRIIELMEEVQRGEGVVERNLQITTRDGAIRNMIVSMQLEEWGGHTYVVTLMHDLTAIMRSRESLRQSETRFRLFFDSIPIPVLVHDTGTLAIIDVNSAACRNYGYQREEFLGQPISIVRLADDRADFIRLLQSMPDDRRAYVQTKHIRKDGTIFDVEVFSYGLTLDGRTVRLAVAQDITNSLEMQRALQSSEERLRLVAEAATDAIWDYDPVDGTVNYLHGVHSLFGYAPGVQPAFDWWVQRLHPEDCESVMASLKAALDSNEEGWTAQYRFQKADQSYAQVLDRAYILRDNQGHAVRVIGAMVDISHQLAIQAAAVRATVEERQRLARDLHDAVTQSLYSLSLMAEAARRRAVLGDLPATREYIERLGELAQQSLKEMRMLVYELQPKVLEQEGLTGALRARLDSIEHRLGIKTTLLADSERVLPTDVQVQLYRVAEEALNNMLQHAGASSVVVRLETSPTHALLEISDNGQGFELPSGGPSGGMGLASMRERVDNLGGVYELDSRPGAGTTVRVTLDLVNGDNHGKRDSNSDL